jgi:hypothetical protein
MGTRICGMQWPSACMKKFAFKNTAHNYAVINLQAKASSMYSHRFSTNKREGDRLTMGYFDNIDNIPLNKYKKNLKMKKKL